MNAARGIARYLRFARRVLRDFGRHHGLLLAGGVGYNLLLSIVPLFASSSIARGTARGLRGVVGAVHHHTARRAAGSALLRRQVFIEPQQESPEAGFTEKRMAHCPWHDR